VWIAQRVTELLGIEDDVLIAYIYEQLEGHKVLKASTVRAGSNLRVLVCVQWDTERYNSGMQTVDPRQLQINLTGFLEKNTSLFCKVHTQRISAACLLCRVFSRYAFSHPAAHCNVYACRWCLLMHVAHLPYGQPCPQPVLLTLCQELSCDSPTLGPPHRPACPVAA
jgi:PWI domain